MVGPLAGVRVIEFAGLGPGPFCGMMLADHGAEVIRIDRVGAKGLVQDPRGDFLNRSRKGFAVNLKHPEGVSLVAKLCKTADALFEGFRPGVMERLGLGPEPLLRDNPKLVYGRMTGFGQDGPYAHMAGHDINYIALSGALHAIGRKNEAPVPPLNLVGDFGGGGMMLAFGMLAAIISARTTGEGQVVDAAMSEGSAVLMAMMYSLRSASHWDDERGSNLLDGAAPFYDAYETKDARHIALGAVEPQFYREMIDLLGLGDDPFMREQNNTALWPAQKRKIADRVRTRSRSEWSTIFDGKDACFSPIMSLDEAPRHPHNVARKAFVEVGGALNPAPAPRYSRTRTARPAPMTAGVDVAVALLGAIGIARHEIDQLKNAGIIA